MVMTTQVPIDPKSLPALKRRLGVQTGDLAERLGVHASEVSRALSMLKPQTGLLDRIAAALMSEAYAQEAAEPAQI